MLLPVPLKVTEGHAEVTVPRGQKPGQGTHRQQSRRARLQTGGHRRFRVFKEAQGMLISVSRDTYKHPPPSSSTDDIGNSSPLVLNLIQIELCPESYRACCLFNILLGPHPRRGAICHFALPVRTVPLCASARVPPWLWTSGLFARSALYGPML